MSDPPDFESEPQRAALNADDAPEDFEPSATDLDDALRRHPLGRIRVAQVVTLLIVLATLGGLLLRSGAITFNHPQPTANHPQPKLTPTLDISGPIVLLSNVSNGTVTLNGAPLSGSTPLITTFKRGLNTLTLSAPPFATHTCYVEWPSGAVNGACNQQPGGGAPQSFGGQIVSPVMLISLPALFEYLPDTLQGQAVAAATDALQSVAPQITVPAGEYYATGQDANGNVISQRATEPLQAKLLAYTSAFDYNGDLFLSNASSGLPGNQLAWRAEAVIQLHWRFTANSGGHANSAEWATQLPESVVMTYDAQRGWSLDQDFTQRLAGYGLADGLVQYVCAAGFDALNTVAQQQSDYVATRNNHLQGCEFDLMTLQNASAGRFIYRFGVLLAADAQAHALLPDLPLAPATALAAFGA